MIIFTTGSYRLTVHQSQSDNLTMGISLFPNLNPKTTSLHFIPNITSYRLTHSFLKNTLKSVLIVNAREEFCLIRSDFSKHINDFIYEVEAALLNVQPKVQKYLYF